MRREVLVKAVERILRDVRETEIQEAIEKIVENSRPSQQGREQPVLFPLMAITKYAVATANYSDAENKVRSILDLDVLTRHEFWEKLIVAGDRGLALTTRNAIKFAFNHLPKLLALLEQEHVNEILTGENLPSELRGKTLRRCPRSC